MSAQPIPHPAVEKKQAICKAPLSIFERLLDLCNFTQLICLCHILNETTKPDQFGKSRTWAPIKPSAFAEISRKSEEWAMAAVESLEKSGLILSEYIDGRPNQVRYRISPDLQAETKAEKIRGKCKECQWIGMFATEFVPLPRTAFTKLAPAVDHATYVCTLIVARYTHHWNTERGLWTEPSELTPHDFRLTGLEPGMIKNGLDEAVRLKLIKRTNRAGKASIFESCPENWGTVEKRPLREITPPVRGAKDPAKQLDGSSTKKALEPTKTPPIESGYFRTAVCPKCERVVEVEPISDDLHIPEVLPAENQTPKQPPRAGPKVEKVEKKPVTRQDQAWEIFKRWKTAERNVLKG